MSAGLGRTECVASAVDDPVPNALSHFPVAKNMPSVQLEVVETAVSTTEDEEARDGVLANALQVASEPMRPAAPTTDEMQPAIFRLE